jgi:two-component system CheB/CheR fusion protein
VPGCSTGEEVYSLATLHEFLAKNSNARTMQVFATDISDNALVKARAGIYPASIADQISP